MILTVSDKQKNNATKRSTYFENIVDRLEREYDISGFSILLVAASLMGIICAEFIAHSTPLLVCMTWAILFVTSSLYCIFTGSKKLQYIIAGIVFLRIFIMSIMYSIASLAC